MTPSTLIISTVYQHFILAAQGVQDSGFVSIWKELGITAIFVAMVTGAVTYFGTRTKNDAEALKAIAEGDKSSADAANVIFGEAMTMLAEVKEERNQQRAKIEELLHKVGLLEGKVLHLEETQAALANALAEIALLKQQLDDALRMYETTKLQLSHANDQVQEAHRDRDEKVQLLTKRAEEAEETLKHARARANDCSQRYDLKVKELELAHESIGTLEAQLGVIKTSEYATQSLHEMIDASDA
jgi:chromosome segregation ATPase